MAGVLSAAAALAIGHLVSAPINPAASPILAVGSTLVDLAPQPVKAFAIDTFGEQDKTVLLGAIGLVLVVLAAAVGALSRHRLAVGVVAILAFGGAGIVAALVRPVARPVDAVPAIAGTAAGVVVLVGLVRPLGPYQTRPAPPAGSAVDSSRRRFLVSAAAVAVLSAVAGGLGTAMTAARASAIARFVVPTPHDPAPPRPAGATLSIPGISPFQTPIDQFYRVDTALDVPAIDPATWRLRVHGMVDHEVELSFADLLELPMIERDITLTCVSNVVGGPYVGTARWIGVPIRTVLDIAGVQSGADQIASRSVDGMTIGTPRAIALDGRDAILAVAMNGQPLPAVHGFPVRMIVPGLYGYVSATKWLAELELTTFAAYDPYWVRRGWARHGPIKTMSRIDTPRALSTVSAGTVQIAGVAWAQHRGIAHVQVRIDAGDWQTAQLAVVDSVDTWRQWTLPWTASPGRHRIEVRAVDSAGVIQTETRTEPFPDGATGWHSIVMTVA